MTVQGSVGVPNLPFSVDTWVLLLITGTKCWSYTPVFTQLRPANTPRTAPFTGLWNARIIVKRSVFFFKLHTLIVKVFFKGVVAPISKLQPSLAGVRVLVLSPRHVTFVSHFSFKGTFSCFQINTSRREREAIEDGIFSCIICLNLQLMTFCFIPVKGRLSSGTSWSSHSFTHFLAVVLHDPVTLSLTF